MALGMLAGGEVGLDDVPDEIGGGGDFRLVGAAHGKKPVGVIALF
jgi:hypothetical protein